jgi:hypothetical protein
MNRSPPPQRPTTADRWMERGGTRRPANSCSLFGWLVADGWCWFVLREDYCWLVAAGCWWLIRSERKVLLAGG